MRHLLVATILLLSACTPDTQPYLVVTSDIHLSDPAGRWPYTTERFESFLRGLEDDPPQTLFIVGDVVDNVRKMPDGSIKPGDAGYWSGEVDLYNGMQDILPRTAFRQSLGPGHDFIGAVTWEMARENLDAQNGSMLWKGYKLIWFTVPVASFWPGGVYRDSLSEADYEWLIEELRSTKQAVLLFHVPLRTQITFQFGKWPGGANLTIEPRDRLYQIIGEHASHIAAIFNGHIHRFVQTDYHNVPLYLCPLIDKGCHCKVYADDRGLRVQPVNCH